MTHLLVKTESMPIAMDLSSVMPRSQLDEAQFHEFCRANPELRIERSTTGEVIVMSPTFSDTGNRNFKIAQQLGNWADRDGTGEVFDSSTGFRLPNGAIRSPDVAWVKRDRWEALTDSDKASFAPICPDFVVELRSHSDTIADLQTKMQEYVENGVQLGLLVDRHSRTVWLYRPGREAESLDNPDTVSCEPELPGFVLEMRRIW